MPRTSIRSSLLVAGSTLLACGGQIGSSSNASDAAGGGTTGTACAADEAGTVTDDGGAPYEGAVVASMSNSSPLLWAGFPYFGSFPTASAGTTCNCAGGIPDPPPSRSAGTVAVQAAHCGPLLASLFFDTEAGAFPEYTQSHAAFTPGDAFSISAPGDPSAIHAFAGTLQTPVPIAGLSPAFGPSAQNLVISVNEDLVVSWTPEGRPGETVDVVLSELGPTSIVECACFAPDSAGTLTLPASLLVQHFTETTTGVSANAGASRTIDTLVGADDAVVHLVGVVAVGGPVLLQSFHP
jgi:hypothetical protein